MKEILGITATPLNIWTSEEGRWDRLNIYHLDDYNTENYVGFRDLEYICLDEHFDEYYIPPAMMDIGSQTEQVVGFLEHCLLEDSSILDKGNRVFIPAHIGMSTHNAVRQRILGRDKNVVVIVINGNEKTISFYPTELTNNLRTIDIMSINGEELSETLSRILTIEGLLDRTIVYTGFLCISMGQTLVNKTIGSFTHSILCQLGLTNCDMYQLAGRLNGRMLNWPTYKKTKVYCPSLIKEIIINMEQCAFGMASLARSSETTNASRDEYIEYMSESIIDNNRKQKQPKPVKDTTNMRVPVIIENIDPQHPIFDMKRSLSTKKRLELIVSLVSELGPDYEKLLHFIQHPDVVTGKISSVSSSSSYKKRIINVVNAALKKKPYSVEIYSKHKKNNYWNLYIDDKEHRLCFVFWVLDDTLY